MLIKDMEWIECEHCGLRKRGAEPVFGCDECRAVLDLNKATEYLSATVHSHDEAAQDLHFCSWRCALKKLATIETDYFISLPYLSYDVGPAVNAAAFFREMGIPVKEE